MFIVIEMQSGDSTATIVNAYADINVAYQKFYSVLSAAAVSSVPIHTAVMLTDTGTLVRSETFRHVVEEGGDD